MNPTAVVLNGSIPYRGFDSDGLFYPVEAIQQLIPLSIPDLEPDTFKQFKVSNYIDCDLRVIAFHAHIIDDTNNNSGNIPFSINQVTKVDLSLVDSQEETSIFKLLSLPVSPTSAGLIDYLILGKNQIFQISVSSQIKKLTLFCKPIYLLPKIDIITSNQT